MNQIIYAGKHLITYEVPRHAHSSWELIYCTGGSGTLYYDEGSLPYGEGDVLVIPPLVPHRNGSGTGFTNIHLNMTASGLDFRKPVLLHDDGNHFLLDAFSAAFFRFSADPGTQTELLATYAHLIVCLIRAGSERTPENPAVEKIRLCIIRSYPDESFSLEAYLRSLPFNYDYLRKLFRSETGLTPHQYLSDLRLHAAAERLSFEDAKVSVAEVARMCGFRDPLYFSRSFRKKFGLSPSDYRQRMLSAEREIPDGDSIKLRL